MMRQINQTKKPAINEHISLSTIGKGILISYIITIPLFSIFAFILTYTDFPQHMIKPVVLITTIISVLVAGSFVAKNAKSKGWLNGGAVGLLYMLLLYIASSIVLRDFSINRYILTIMIIGVLTGSIGGIVGINFRYSSHSRRKIKKVIKR